MPTLLTQYNFLRSYANSSQLEHLTNDERFQLLQRIISSGQSESSWRAILELFASWPDSVEKSHALEHADEQLSTWDDSLRTVNSAWIYLYENSHLSSVAVIVRLININRREQYGNKELKAITTSPFVASLKGLTIYKSEIHSDGINALVNSSYLQHLESLSIDGVTLQENGFELLCNAQNLPMLKNLQLKNVGINGTRLKVLAKSNLVQHVTNLDLSYNSIDGESVNDLNQLLVRNEFNSLNLEGNFMQLNGALNLVKTIPRNSLRELNLARNEIMNSGREELRTLSLEMGIKLIVD